MSKYSESNLELLYAEICAGYSSAIISFPKEYSKKNLTIYYKHPTHCELFALDKEKEKFYKEAPPDLLSANDALELIIKEGWWTRENEEKIRLTNEFIARLEDTISKIPIEAHRAELHVQLKENRDIVEELEKKRAQFMPQTLDDFAAKRINDLCLTKFIYSDSSLSSLLFSEDEYCDLPNTVSNIIQLEYYNLLNKLNSNNIRKLSCGVFFQNLLHVSGDVVQNFFGTPTYKLTKYQYELFLSGRHFKTILTNCAQIDKEIPNSILGDPEAMEKHHNFVIAAYNHQNKKNSRYSGAGGASSLVGATSEENKALFGREAGGAGILQAAKSAGGRVNLLTRRG